MDTLVASFNFPGSYRNMINPVGPGAVIMGANDGLWCVTNGNTGFLNFNPVTEEWTIYDETNLPIT